MSFDSSQSKAGRALRRTPFAVIADAVLITVSLYAAYLLRLEFDITPFYWEQIQVLLPLVVLIRLASLLYFDSYSGLWKYTSIHDLVKLLMAVTLGLVVLVLINFFRNYPLAVFISVAFAIAVVTLKLKRRFRLLGLLRMRRSVFTVGSLAVASAVFGGVSFALYPEATKAAFLSQIRLITDLDFPQSLSMPRSVLVFEPLLTIVLLGGIRVLPRIYIELRSSRNAKGRRLLVFGAGDLGENLVRTVRRHPQWGYRVVGYIDDDDEKSGTMIHGIRVLGRVEEISTVIEELSVDELVVAVANPDSELLRRVGSFCWRNGIPMRRVTGMSRFISSDLGIETLKEINIVDLLGRSEVELDPARVRDYLHDRVVLVTGAGGSIGSELCRQISQCEPRRLILMGKGENSIYQIGAELSQGFPQLEAVSVIGDVTDSAKVNDLFARQCPEVVFHAAAHKHVPFMELHPEQAVHNNVVGTLTVGRAALEHGASRFVLISTDKAVKPSSVMGATKRLAENTLQLLSTKGSTSFITVRFGNVLRSRGSVVPLFERQIEAGGPLTLTHPDMRRFFMSIPEAVRLVLHSGANGDNGNLCVLDMGQQVKIVDLARNMITMAGKRPYEDIDIVTLGPRPGEKLSEELLTEEEAESARVVDKILFCSPEGIDVSSFEAALKNLLLAATRCDTDALLLQLHQIVPSYQSPEFETSKVLD